MNIALFSRRKYMRKRVNPEGAPASIADCEIFLASDSFAYTGDPITPQVTVVYKGATLVVNTDYFVSYNDNVNVGSGTVVVTGAGDFIGSQIKTFVITSPVPLSWSLENTHTDHNGIIYALSSDGVDFAWGEDNTLVIGGGVDDQTIGGVSRYYYCQVSQDGIVDFDSAVEKTASANAGVEGHGFRFVDDGYGLITCRNKVFSHHVLSTAYDIESITSSYDLFEGHLRADYEDYRIADLSVDRSAGKVYLYGIVNHYDSAGGESDVGIRVFELYKYAGENRYRAEVVGTCHDLDVVGTRITGLCIYNSGSNAIVVYETGLVLNVSLTTPYRIDLDVVESGHSQVFAPGWSVRSLLMKNEDFLLCATSMDRIDTYRIHYSTPPVRPEWDFDIADATFVKSVDLSSMSSSFRSVNVSGNGVDAIAVTGSGLYLRHLKIRDYNPSDVTNVLLSHEGKEYDFASTSDGVHVYTCRDLGQNFAFYQFSLEQSFDVDEIEKSSSAVAIRSLPGINGGYSMFVYVSKDGNNAVVGVYYGPRAHIYGYSLQAPFDLTSASLIGKYDEGGSEGLRFRNIAMSPDGLSFVGIHFRSSGLRMRKYKLSVPYDFSTTELEEEKVFAETTDNFGAGWINIDDSGTNAICGCGNNKMFMFRLRP